MTKKRILILIVGVLTVVLAMFVCDSGDAHELKKRPHGNAVVIALKRLPV